MAQRSDDTTAKRIGAVIKSCRNILRKDKGLNTDLDRIPQLIWMMFLKFIDDLENTDEDSAILSGNEYASLIPSPYRWRDWASQNDGLTGDDLIKFVEQDEALDPNGNSGPGLLYKLSNLQPRFHDDRRHVLALVCSGLSNRMSNGYLMRDVINKIDTLNFSSTDELHLLSRFYENMLKEMRDAAGSSGEFYTPRPVVELMVLLTDPELGETILDPASGTGGFLVESFKHLQSQVTNTSEYEVLQQDTIFGGEAKTLPFLLCLMNLLLNGLSRPQINYGNSLKKKLTEIGDSDRVDVILANPPFGGEEEESITQFYPPNFKTTETALLFMLQIVRLLKRKSSGKSKKKSRAAVIVPDGILASTGVGARVIHHIISNYNLHSIIQLPEGVFLPYTLIPANILFIESGSPTTKIRYFEHRPPPDISNYTKTRPLKFDHFEPIIEKWKDFDGLDNCWDKDVNELITLDNKGVCTAVRLDNINPNHMNPIPLMDSDSIISRSKHLTKEFESILSSHSPLHSLKYESWQTRKISSFCKQVDRKEELLGYQEYQLMGVSLEGRGPFIREVKTGSEISSKKAQRVECGDFIYSRLFAWKGSFGIINEEQSGCYCSNEFPIFRCDDSVLDEYLLLYFLQPSTWRQVESYCTGTTKASRNRFKEHYFLEMEIPVPPMDVQKKMVGHYRGVKVAINKLHEIDEVMAILPEAELFNIFGHQSPIE